MNARLSTCFGLSVLLHALVLLVLSSYLGLGNHRYGNQDSSASLKLDVYLPATNNPVPQAAIPKPRNEETVPVPSPKQKNAVAAEANPNTSRGSPSLPFGLGNPTPPLGQAQYQAQMSARQMYEMQARQQALAQTQMMITRLQQDIALGLNRNGIPMVGECSWQENPQTDPDKLVCDPAELDALMQPQAQQFKALRKAIATLGSVLDGFTLTTKGAAATITYRTHAANAAPKR